MGNVLKTSNTMYVAALKADRVPIQGDADLAIWWEVRVQSTSTTNTLMSFQISSSGSSTWALWNNVPSMRPASNAMPRWRWPTSFITRKDVATLPS